MGKAFNPFEHHHDHGHDHEHEHPHEHAHGSAHPIAGVELDPAQRALADAMQVSFNLLKTIMLVLVVVYLFSGIVWGIPEQKVGVRLRLGQIVGDNNEDRILKPGKIYWALPYPIEQTVLIPTAPQQLELAREFWFELPANATSDEGRSGPLNPEKDGSLLTGDRNIIHARWTVKYRIEQPIDFILNVATPTSDDRVVLAAAEQMVRSAAEQGIIFAVAQTTAEDANRGNIRPELARKRAQQVLSELKTGIMLTEVTAAKPVFPVSVRPDFEAVTKASSEKAQALDKARQDAIKTLVEVAGQAHEPILELVDRYELARASLDRDQLKKLDQRLDWILNQLKAPAWAAATGAQGDRLWDALFAYDLALKQGQEQAIDAAATTLSQTLDQARIPLAKRSLIDIGGEVSQVLRQAQAYRSSVVADVQAKARAFNPRAIDPQSLLQGLLDQYNENPRVFVSRRRQEMMEAILAGDVETFYLPPGQAYLELNRDQELRKRREQEKLKADKK